MKIENQKKKFLSKIEDNQESRLYLLHHMHHFKVGSDVKHELHHCFLFGQKNMKGKKYQVVHKFYKNNCFHCLKEKFNGILYDHAGNRFSIKPKKLGKQTIYEVKF
ncbi:hypothetical protein MUP35_01530 [Patescibacteria group bacterium]|nr:hypothetical protein [Patescibacteria group bacterium]